MGGGHHEPFKALGPIDWSEISSQSEGGSLPSFLSSTFASAQTLVDSIPEIPKSASGSTSSTASGRARAATDSAAAAPHQHQVATASATSTAGDAELAARIRKDWKGVKVGPKENPMGISVWKLSSSGGDGRGAWFARRSVHREPAYERWRAGLAGEFEETLRRNRRAPGGGGGDQGGMHRIRGIGAEKRVEEMGVEGVADLHVYLLSVRFPGPTTPRDFVTLLITNRDGEEQEEEEKKRKKDGRKPRQFMIISKPCRHPDAPQRQGFIRGQYESVEVIREVPVGKPLRRTKSSVDVSGDDFARPAVEADDSVPDVQQAKSDVGAQDEDGEPEYAIEWLMITRSDPGGSVPRFMVDKGTPPGICTDAGKFVKWLHSEDFVRPHDAAADNQGQQSTAGAEQDDTTAAQPARSVSGTAPGTVSDEDEEDEGEDASGGLYGMITNALGIAGSYVASLAGSGRDTNSEVDTLNGGSSDTQSTASDSDYASAEGGPTPVGTKAANFDDLASSAPSTKSALSEESAAPSMAGISKHEKQLRKLEERKRKAEEKMARMHGQALERQASAQSQKDKEKEAITLQKMKEKHEREVAKQEEKFRREVRKLEEKKAKEERKEEARRRKAQERDERANVQVELERTRAERDIALKQADILREQVGELQAQNTMLVAKLGKLENADDTVPEKGL